MTYRTPSLMLLLLVATLGAKGQEAAPAKDPAAPATPAAAPAPDTSSVILASKPAPAPLPASDDADSNTRSVSAKVAADLALGMPKYDPPKPTPVPAADPQDLRDIDKPKNEIKRLPKYVVHESKPPIFTQNSMLTEAGKIDLSLRNHPGLLIGNLFGLNSDFAKQMMQDEERLSAIDDLTDTARAMARGGDPAEAKYILQASQDAYMQNAPLWTWNGPGGNGGNSGGTSR